MAKRQIALITPSVIKWAREKAHYSIEVAAKKIGVATEKLKEWEDEKSNPTLTQARKMSQIYKRPLASFYLPNPPRDFPLLKDFRTIESQKNSRYSTPLVFLMRQMQERQTWLSQYLKDKGYEKLSFVGSKNKNSSPKIISKDIVKTLWESLVQYNNEVIFQNNSPENLLDKWIVQCEQKGIFISRTSNLNSHNVIKVEEARGFVISDKYAPFIFINSGDSKTAQLFTLIHELAHLWLDVSGVPSNYLSSSNNIEFLCNQTAAEILMPENKIKALSEFKNLRENEKREWIKEQSKYFNVSPLALLIRLKQFSMLKSTFFEKLKNEYIKEYEKHKKEKKQKMKMKKVPGGPDANLLKIYANGKSFTKIVFSSYKEGFLSGREASNLLDMKLKRMEKIINLMRPI